MRSGDEGGPSLLTPATGFQRVHHFSWDNFPTNTMAYDIILHFFGDVNEEVCFSDANKLGK